MGKVDPSAAALFERHAFKMKMRKDAKEQFAGTYKDNTWDEPTRRKAPYLMIFYKILETK